MKKTIITIVVIAAALLQSAESVEIQWTGASTNGPALDDPDNWEGGVLPTNSADLGIIGDGDTVQTVSGVTYTNYHLDLQTGGSWGGTGLGPGILSGGELAINGGTLGPFRGVNLANGQIATLNSGLWNIKDADLRLTDSGTTVNINGGALTGQSNRGITLDEGTVLNVNGGTIGAADSYIHHIGGNTIFQRNSGTANFYGGDSYFTDLRGAYSSSSLMVYNIIGSSGSINAVSIGAYGDRIQINFEPGTAMSLSITNETDWAETLWNAGQLTYDGQGTNELSNTWAEVTAEDGLEPGVRFNYDSATKTLYLAGSALPPQPPAGLAATPGDGFVDLDWNDVAESGVTYRVYRSTASGSYGSPVESDLSSSDYVDNTVGNGILYYYVVTAVKTNGLESAPSGEVSVTPGDFIAPAAPTGVTATPGSNTVSLSWNPSGEDDFASYSVYRSTVSDDYSDALVTNLPSNSYVDNTAENGTTYYYIVTATDTSGNESDPSSEVVATPDASGLSGYALWLAENGVTDTDENFYEYAMDSDPNDGLASTNNPVLVEAGGAYFYVYPKRSDDSSITYTVETTTDLVTGIWSNEGYTVAGTEVTGDTLNFVTNAVDTAESERFIRLKIE